MQIHQEATLATTTAYDSPSATDNSSTSASGDSTITANDFLTLLVAEMKNQDPTADNDPNAYIDQLVQVNSLQQLIQINGDLGGSSSSSSSGDASSEAVSAASRLATSLAPHSGQHLQSHASRENSFDKPVSAVQQAEGSFKEKLQS